MNGETVAAMTTEHVVYGLDVFLAAVLGVIIVLGLIRAMHVGGWAFGKFFYALMDFFSKLYQSALGICVALLILLAVYLYFTSKGQRLEHRTALEKATPNTAYVISQAVNANTDDVRNATSLAFRHMKQLAEAFIAQTE